MNLCKYLMNFNFNYLQFIYGIMWTFCSNLVQKVGSRKMLLLAHTKILLFFGIKKMNNKNGCKIFKRKIFDTLGVSHSCCCLQRFLVNLFILVILLVLLRVNEINNDYKSNGKFVIVFFWKNVIWMVLTGKWQINVTN